MEKLSVIIPVYNTKTYIPVCLESMINQSYANLEIIVIDDGSTDDSYAMVMDYQTRYPNLIQVIHQENQGISAVRNRGMQLATGRYLTFLDSDDYVETTMYEKMMSKAIANDLDIVVCDFYEDEEASGASRIEKLPSFATTHLSKQPDLLYNINSSPWNKLYRSEFLRQHQLLFPLNCKYEDAEFVLLALEKATSIGKVDEALLHYIIHSGSETTVMNEKVRDIFVILEHIKDAYAKSEFASLYEEALEYFFIRRITIYCLQQAYQKDASFAYAFIDDAYAFLHKHYPAWRKNPVFHERESKLKFILKQHKQLMKMMVRLVRSKKRGTL